MTSKIYLVCLLKCDTPTFSGAFKIEVPGDYDTFGLKKLLQASPQSPSCLRNVGEADLTLYRVSIEDGDITALQEAMRLIDQPGAEGLGLWETIREVFPSPAARHVHLIIKIRGKLPS